MKDVIFKFMICLFSSYLIHLTHLERILFTVFNPNYNVSYLVPVVFLFGAKTSLGGTKNVSMQDKVFFVVVVLVNWSVKPRSLICIQHFFGLLGAAEGNFCLFSC